jgi:hypothetical protein
MQWYTIFFLKEANMTYLFSTLMLVTSLFLVPASALWAKEALPSYAACKPISVKKDPFIVGSDKPVLLLIHNVSSSELWLTHPSDKGVSAGWSSQIQGGNWSALVLNKKSFALQCIESQPGHEQQVPCIGLITVCQWTKDVKFASPNTAWAGENKPLKELMQSVL